MAIANGYATLAQAKAWMDITSTNSGDDTIIENIIEAASRAIDNICNRFFYAASSATRYYTPELSSLVWIDDLSTTSSLLVYTDDDGDGTYENTWATTDYNVYPYNPKNGHPYTSIERSVFGTHSFPVGLPRALKMIGTFGWAAVPLDIQQACLIIAQAEYRSRNGSTISEVAQVTAAGVVMSPKGIPVAAMDKLRPYIKVTP